jgi:hypothetical protein
MIKNITPWLLVLSLIPAGAMAAGNKKQASAPAQAQHGDSVPAGEPDTDSCGIGWQVTNKKTLMATCTRGTTNAFVPPTFGMTTGTMGCAKHDFSSVQDKDAAVYAATNLDSLSIEMAEGRGETLQGFARAMGCNDAAFGSFSRMTQDNYKNIVNGGSASGLQVFDNVKNQIHADPVLSASCRS